MVLLTLGADELVLDVGIIEPKRPARSSTTPADLPFDGALSSKSIRDKSFFADELPSSAGIGFDEKE